MGSITLGLDLGSNSIGWTIIDREAQRIIAAGVRVFPEGVDAFDTAKEKSRTQERRIKRGMRRQIARRARRKRVLRMILSAHKLLPADANQQTAVLAMEPYLLRARGLDHPLSPFELGRVLFHLGVRRGFLSNSKSDKSKAKETSDMLKEISELEAQIQNAGHRTLGEHIASLVAKPGEKPLIRIRSKHTRRDMLRREFDLLWAAQRVHHPTLLTEELKLKLDDPKGDETWWMRGAIFGQRNLYWPASMIGKCEYETKERRAPKSDRIAQRFRLLSEVNNLKYIDPISGKVCLLDQGQRSVLLDHLSKAKEMTFDQLRKKLNFPQNVQFNLEKGERAKLKGHLTDYLMAKESPFGKQWWDLSESSKNEIVRILLDPRSNDDSIKYAAVNKWGLSAEQAELLPSVGLPDGYASLSRKAMEKLVPHMEAGVLLMTDDNTPCALTLAGYLRPDQRTHKRLHQLPEPPDLPNPVVRTTLHELRRLVNAILREYGRTHRVDRIHIELARDIKMGPDKRSEYNKAMRDREAERAKAADAIREESPGAKLSRDLIDKYLLWEQQGGRCVYSGYSISLRQLLGGEIQVDHILPRWRSLDDSFANKVVCFREMNRDKGDRTPYEWLHGKPAEFEALKQRIRALPFRKRARFTQEEINTDEFAARQLVDTAYITRAAADYLRCLVEEPHHVLGGKGTYTAELRHLWGIETVLSELPDSPAWAAQADLRPGEKNRADHRHHAIDAIVVALTDQGRLQKLSKLYKTGEAGAEILPWEGFRTSVLESVKRINVSHRVQRKVSGALHKETLYGAVKKKNLRGELEEQPGEFVVRKNLVDLTPSMVEEIRDETIRAIVKRRLEERGVKCGRNAKGNIPAATWEPLLTMPSGVPIHKVRLLVSMGEEGVARLSAGRIVAMGSNHHVEIFKLPNGKQSSRIVSTLEAVQRIKAGRSIIDRTHPAGGCFVMSLSINEMLLIEVLPGKNELLRVQKMDVNGSIILRPHTFAGRQRDTDKPPLIVRKSGTTIQGKKVTVDPLGRIRWAND
jgi:CRISPR-associated endonuclease Csn1